MVYLLAAGAALTSAVATVLQRMGVESAPAGSSLRPGVVLHAVRRLVWLGGFALLLVTFGLQASALRFGALNVVQPVLTLELLFVVAILAVFFHHRPGGREWAGAAAVVAGLACFLVVASPSRGRGVPAPAGWVVIGAGAAVVVTGLLLGAQRGPAAWRAAAYGGAAAVLFAVNASLTKSVTSLVATGWGHVFVRPEPYALAVVGAAGLALYQSALHAGPVAASKAAMVVLSPLASVAIGVGAFAEHLRSGPLAVSGEVAALVLLCAGGVALARSPLVAGTPADGGRGMLLRPAPAPAPAPAES